VPTNDTGPAQSPSPTSREEVGSRLRVKRPVEFSQAHRFVSAGPKAPGPQSWADGCYFLSHPASPIVRSDPQTCCCRLQENRIALSFFQEESHGMSSEEVFRGARITLHSRVLSPFTRCDLSSKIYHNSQQSDKTCKFNVSHYSPPTKSSSDFRTVSTKKIDRKETHRTVFAAAPTHRTSAPE
jgi:hypothetical protein